MLTATGDSFLADVVLPAFGIIRKKLESKKRMVAVDREASEVTIISTYHAQLEIKYTMGVETNKDGDFPVVQTSFRDPLTGRDQATQPQPFGQQGEEPANISQITKDDIVNDFFRNYKPDTGAEVSDGYKLQPGDLL